MAFTGKPYKSTVVIKTNKEEDDDTSSGYVYTIGENGTTVAVSDVGSSYLPSSTRETSVFPRNKFKGTNICKQTRKKDTDTSTGTEICIGCLLKGDEKKQATHFCKTCDAYGRYICYTCMVDHNLWAGKNHDVVSLSVDRGTERNWAKRNSDVMRRPKMPLPDDYQKLNQHLDEETYEQYRAVERETKKLMINESNDISGQVSESFSTQPENIQAQRQGRLNGTRLKISNKDQANNDANRHELHRRSLVVDGYRQPFVTYDNTELDYTLAELYNETQNNVKYNPLRTKRTPCVVM